MWSWEYFEVSWILELSFQTQKTHKLIYSYYKALLVNIFNTHQLVMTTLTTTRLVRGGTLGQILLRACTVYISYSELDSGLSTWVEPYKSDSGQFCLSYNHIKYELRHFFSADFRSQLSLFVCSRICTRDSGRELNLSGQSQICTQYMLGVRFVCACHLALTRYFTVNWIQEMSF